MVTIVPIDTPTLGDRSYLAHDGEVALVVDPQRDIDRVLALAQQAGVRVTHVCTTTTSPAAWRWHGRPARRTTSTPPTGWPTSGSRCVTVTWSR